MASDESGVKVACSDGWAGKLKGLVLDPGTCAPTHLVVETGDQAPQDAVVPAARVLVHGFEAIFLDLTLGQLMATCVTPRI